MRRRLTALLALALIAGPAQARVSVGDRFPSLRVRTWAGEETVLTVPDGNLVLVDVWASWCAPCREALPALAKMARELREQGIQVWLINIDGDHAKATAFLDQVLADRESVHLFFDPAGVSTSALGAPGMPTLYVIEAATVRRIEVGYSEDRIKALKADISPREAP